MSGGLALLVGGVQVGLLGGELLDDPDVPLVGGAGQGGEAHLVPGHDRGLGLRQDRLHGVVVAVIGGEDQEAVAPSVGDVGGLAGLEVFVQGLRVPLAGGLEGNLAELGHGGGVEHDWLWFGRLSRVREPGAGLGVS